MFRLKNSSRSSRLAPLRSYILAMLLLLASGGLMLIGDRYLIRYGFPWALVALLVVAAVSNLWGGRPAMMVLVIAALFGDLVVPDLHISYFYGQDLSWRIRIMRGVLFAVCGGAIIWLSYQARLMHEKAERRRGVVEALQRMILPEHLAEVPGYELSCVYRPARHEEEVGGDFYDFFPLASGTYGILIGDVMGKGKEAAAYTALLRYSVRAFSSLSAGPGQILGQLDFLIETEQTGFGTASLFLGVLDARSGVLQYASAGHEPPLLLRGDGTEEALEATGPIIGVGAGLPYGEKTVPLNLGDALLLMTDGVSEARNAQGEFLDSEGVWRLFRATKSAPTAAHGLALLDHALEAFIGSNSRDDIAMLLLRREPGRLAYRGSRNATKSVREAVPTVPMSFTGIDATRP